MRSLYSRIFALLILGISFTSAQLSTPGRFALRLAAQDTSLSEGLLSNIVAEIRLVGDSLTWFGTGRGLAMHEASVCKEDRAVCHCLQRLLLQINAHRQHFQLELMSCK